MNGKVVLITGASRGLGAALAAELAARGARLVLTARHTVPLHDIAERLRTRTDVVAHAGDAADDATMRMVVEHAHTHFGHLDVLVNNASTLGGSPMRALEQLATGAFFETMDVNVRAPLAIAQMVLPRMRRRRSGLIVNVTSDAAVNAYAGWGAYGTSKAALEHLSRILAEELRDSGVRVMVVDPGNLNTQMHAEAEPGEDLSSLPLPETVAPAFADLIEGVSSHYSRHELQHVGVGV